MMVKNKEEKSKESAGVFGLDPFLKIEENVDTSVPQAKTQLPEKAVASLAGTITLQFDEYIIYHTRCHGTSIDPQHVIAQLFRYHNFPTGKYKKIVDHPTGSSKLMR
jgi:hypothetical protein